MSDNKKYYYMRLKDNFFESEELKSIESLKDGHKYSNILLKMYLRSLKRNGKLMLTDTIPYDTKILAKIVGHTEKNVKKAIDLFVEYELIEVLDSGAMYMLNIQEYIGASSSEGDRKRNYRKRIKEEKTKDICPDIRPPEIEKEIDIYKVKEDGKELIHIYDEFCDKLEMRYPKEKLDKDASFERWKNLYLFQLQKHNDKNKAFNILGGAVWNYLMNYKETNTKDGEVNYTYLCFLSSLFGDKYDSHLAPYIEAAERKAENDIQTISEFRQMETERTSSI